MTTPNAPYPIGTKGHYYSSKGEESSRHGQPGEVVELVGQKMLIKFQEPLGLHLATRAQFEPI